MEESKKSAGCKCEVCKCVDCKCGKTEEASCCGGVADNTCGCGSGNACTCPAGQCKCGSGCACGVGCANKRATVLGIRKPAPYFESGAWYNGMKQVKLTDYKGKLFYYENGVLIMLVIIGKYLVLFFYPLDFTFVCPTEIV